MKKVVFLLFACVFILSGCKEKDQVFIYNWSEYMPDEVIKMFEKETGIKVVYSTYDSNELMYSKIKLQQGSGYDVIFPSSYFVSKMSKEGLLLELDHAQLPNIQYMSQDLLNQDYDKGATYSVPFMWGLSLLAYNKKFIPEGSVSKWADLWKAEYKGYVLLNNDPREVFQLALSILGYSCNSTNRKELEEAYELLKDLMPSVRVFNSDSPKQPFINEEVRIGLLWTGEIYRGMQANPNITYVFPEEGAIGWVDCMSIPKGAKNIENAHKFIDFIMRPDISALIAEKVGYSTPNTAAIALMSEEAQNNRLINPTEEDIKNTGFQDDVGDAVLIYEELWERLKTGR